MTDELMEQRMAELNTHHAEMAPACANEKRAYSVDDIMNKTELITVMAETSGLSKKDCDAALAAFIATIETALKSGDKVQLIGFGSFEVKERAARTGRNPRTKEPVEIPASKAPAFKAGQAFKEAIQ